MLPPSIPASPSFEISTFSPPLIITIGRSWPRFADTLLAPKLIHATKVPTTDQRPSSPKLLFQLSTSRYQQPAANRGYVYGNGPQAHVSVGNKHLSMRGKLHYKHETSCTYNRNHKLPKIYSKYIFLHSVAGARPPMVHDTELRQQTGEATAIPTLTSTSH
jgi:hypothetical protein